MDWSAFLSQTKEVVSAFFTFMTTALSVVMGLAFFYAGLHKVVDHSKGLRQGQATVGPVLINFAVGALMIQFSTTMSMFVATLFGGGASYSSPSKAMAYVPESVTQGSAMLRTAVEAGIWWVFAIGVVAIFRGLVLWNDLAKGAHQSGSNGWKGLWHVVFGAMAVNMAGVLQLFR